MKKFLLLSLLFFSVSAFSQNALLIDKTWHLYSLDIYDYGGNQHLINLFPNVGEIKFTKNISDDNTYRWDNSYYYLAGATNVIFDSNDRFHIPYEESGWAFLDTIPGDNQEMNDYANLYLSEFLTSPLLCLSCGSRFSYELSDEGKKLTITNDRGNIATFYDSVMAVSETNKPTYKVYPNPVSDILTIENLKPNSSVEIMDASGKIVRKISDNKSAKTEINIKNLSPGIYYLKINNESVHKIIRK